MVHAVCVFVAGIHPSRTWTSVSFESVGWNACEHRLDLGLYSHPKEFWANGVRTHVYCKGKIPSIGKILRWGVSNPGHCIKQDSKPNALPMSYSSSQCDSRDLLKLLTQYNSWDIWTLLTKYNLWDIWTLLTKYNLLDLWTLLTKYNLWDIWTLLTKYNLWDM